MKLSKKELQRKLGILKRASLKQGLEVEVSKDGKELVFTDKETKETKTVSILLLGK